MTGEKSPFDHPVMRLVTPYGARSVHSLIRLGGPKPNWQWLIDHGWLLKVSAGGESLVLLGPAAERYAKAHDRQLRYIKGANVARTIALQATLLEYLQSNGYEHVDTLYRCRNKTLGKTNEAGAQMINTSIIRCHVVRVPEEEFRAIQYVERDPIRYPAYQLLTRSHEGRGPRPQYQVYGEQIPGHPRAYALTGTEAAVRNRIESVYKEHKEHLKTWRTSLIIGVQDDLPYRTFVAALNAKYPLLTHPYVKLNGLVPATPSIKLVSLDGL